MKDGAILCNAGHFNVEISIPELESLSTDVREYRKNIMGYTLADGRTIYLLGEGRLVNLACGDGHPAEIMDMSFAVQAMSALYILENKGKLAPKVFNIPDDIDQKIAARKLESMGVRIDSLTDEQKKYLGSWQV
jgi:adenosylhomocysteinase